MGKSNWRDAVTGGTTGTPLAPIDRLWLPVGSTYRLDQAGWLLDPEDAPFYAATSDAVPTSALSDSQCLVLLGEPGMGKSSALAAHGPLIPPGAASQVLAVDLAPFSSEERLVRKVLEGKEITAWAAGDSELCLTLDSFDEAHARIGNLHQLLGEYLDDWDCSRLLLRVVCRTAEWPNSLETALKRNFGSADRFELLPLRRADAAALVAPQIDPGPFLAAVEAARVVPLAARPLSLKLLAATYRKAGKLPKRASDLYELGLLTLCEELNPERRDAAPDAAVGAKTRLETASRIAAFSIFGGRPTVWTGPIVEADPADLAIDDCTRTPAPGTFQPVIAAATVAATLRTGLFTGAGSQRLGWSHATFADFLAARWISEQDLDRTQVRSLLVSPDGKVHPRVRQVAAWVVAIQPEQFAWLIPADPEAFLLNVDIPEDALRAEVVAEILTNAKAGRLYHDYNRSFSGVTHPRLADQLRDVLSDADFEARRVAMDIARQCNVIALIPELTTIALDGEVDEHLRVSAVLAVHDLSQDSPSHHFAALVRSPVVVEGATQLRELQAAAFIASWPHAISTAEVFDLLDPRHPRNYFGLYSTFVSTFATSLKADDLGAAVAWLINNLDRLDDSRLTPLVNAIVSLGVKHLDRPDALAAVKMVAFKRADNYEPLFTDDVLEGEHELTPHDRRSLALALLEEASEGQVLSVVDSMGNHGLSLIGPNDFTWLVDQYTTADNKLKINLAMAISYVLAPSDLSHIEVVLGLPEDHRAAELFSYWRNTVDLDSAEAKAARESWHKQTERINEQLNRRKKAKRPDLWVNPRIAEQAAEAKTGDTDAFWQAAHDVTVRPGTLRYMDEYQPDLAAHPRWKTLKKKTRKDMLAAAAVYVRHGKCKPEEWLAQDLRWHPAEAGYRALILLLRKRPEELESFEPAAWREWAPILVAWSATNNGAQADDKGALFRLALPHAREELTAALLQLVDKAIADSKHTFLREELDLLHSDHLAAALIDRLEATDVPVEARSDILDTLTTHHIELIRPLLFTWLQREQRTANRERARDAAARLIWSDAPAAWPTLSELMQSDPEFMKEAFLAANHAYERRAPDLTEAQLADLYTWLIEHFPASEDPQFEDAHFVGPRESLATWRESILSNLKQRGTKASVAAVVRIADAHPDRPWLEYVVIDAQSAYRDECWEPLTGKQLDQLSANRESRLVRTEADLFAATVAALETIQARLQGDTPSSSLLWDTHSKRPKSEDEVSDYLSIELQALLRERGAIVNREVQVRRVRPSGLPERTDIRIDALNPGADTDSTEQITVVGEVKGSWNGDIVDSLQTQLVDRYMADLHTSCGIYIVIWFDLESWKDDKDSRRGKAAVHGSADELRTLLAAKAAEIKKTGRHVAVVVLDASLRRPVVTLAPGKAIGTG